MTFPTNKCNDAEHFVKRNGAECLYVTKEYHCQGLAAGKKQIHV